MAQPTVSDVLKNMAMEAIEAGLDEDEAVGFLQKAIQKKIGLSPQELSDMRAVPWEAVKSRQSVQPAEPAAPGPAPLPVSPYGMARQFQQQLQQQPIASGPAFEGVPPEITREPSAPQADLRRRQVAPSPYTRTRKGEPFQVSPLRAYEEEQLVGEHARSQREQLLDPAQSAVLRARAGQRVEKEGADVRGGMVPNRAQRALQYEEGIENIDWQRAAIRTLVEDLRAKGASEDQIKNELRSRGIVSAVGVGPQSGRMIGISSDNLGLGGDYDQGKGETPIGYTQITQRFSETGEPEGITEDFGKLAEDDPKNQFFYPQGGSLKPDVDVPAWLWNNFKSSDWYKKLSKDGRVYGIDAVNWYRDVIRRYDSAVSGAESIAFDPKQEREVNELRRYPSGKPDLPPIASFATAMKHGFGDSGWERIKLDGTEEPADSDDMKMLGVPQEAGAGSHFFGGQAMALSDVPEITSRVRFEKPETHEDVIAREGVLRATYDPQRRAGDDQPFAYTGKSLAGRIDPSDPSTMRVATQQELLRAPVLEARADAARRREGHGLIEQAGQYTALPAARVIGKGTGMAAGAGVGAVTGAVDLIREIAGEDTKLSENLKAREKMIAQYMGNALHQNAAEELFNIFKGVAVDLPSLLVTATSEEEGNATDVLSAMLSSIGSGYDIGKSIGRSALADVAVMFTDPYGSFRTNPIIFSQTATQVVKAAAKTLKKVDPVRAAYLESVAADAGQVLKQVGAGATRLSAAAKSRLIELMDDSKAAQDANMSKLVDEVAGAEQVVDMRQSPQMADDQQRAAELNKSLGPMDSSGQLTSMPVTRMHSVAGRGDSLGDLGMVEATNRANRRMRQDPLAPTRTANISPITHGVDPYEYRPSLTPGGALRPRDPRLSSADGPAEIMQGMSMLVDELPAIPPAPKAPKKPELTPREKQTAALIEMYGDPHAQAKVAAAGRVAGPFVDTSSRGYIPRTPAMEALWKEVVDVTKSELVKLAPVVMQRIENIEGRTPRTGRLTSDKAREEQGRPPGDDKPTGELRKETPYEGAFKTLQDLHNIVGVVNELHGLEKVQLIRAIDDALKGSPAGKPGPGGRVYSPDIAAADLMAPATEGGRTVGRRLGRKDWKDVPGAKPKAAREGASYAKLKETYDRILANAKMSVLQKSAASERALAESKRFDEAAKALEQRPKTTPEQRRQDVDWEAIDILDDLPNAATRWREYAAAYDQNTKFLELAQSKSSKRKQLVEIANHLGVSHKDLKIGALRRNIITELKTRYAGPRDGRAYGAPSIESLAEGAEFLAGVRSKDGRGWARLTPEERRAALGYEFDRSQGARLAQTKLEGDVVRADPSAVQIAGWQSWPGGPGSSPGGPYIGGVPRAVVKAQAALVELADPKTAEKINKVLSGVAPLKKTAKKLEVAKRFRQAAEKRKAKAEELKKEAARWEYAVKTHTEPKFQQDRGRFLKKVEETFGKSARDKASLRGDRPAFEGKTQKDRLENAAKLERRKPLSSEDLDLARQLAKEAEGASISFDTGLIQASKGIEAMDGLLALANKYDVHIPSTGVQTPKSLLRRLERHRPVTVVARPVTTEAGMAIESVFLGRKGGGGLAKLTKKQVIDGLIQERLGDIVQAADGRPVVFRGDMSADELASLHPALVVSSDGKLMLAGRYHESVRPQRIYAKESGAKFLEDSYDRGGKQKHGLDPETKMILDRVYPKFKEQEVKRRLGLVSQGIKPKGQLGYVVPSNNRIMRRVDESPLDGGVVGSEVVKDAVKAKGVYSQNSKIPGAHSVVVDSLEMSAEARLKAVKEVRREAVERSINATKDAEGRPLIPPITDKPPSSFMLDALFGSDEASKVLSKYVELKPGNAKHDSVRSYLGLDKDKPYYMSNGLIKRFEFMSEYDKAWATPSGPMQNFFNFIKANLAARNVGTYIGNFTSNMFMEMIATGNPMPLGRLYRVSRDARDYQSGGMLKSERELHDFKKTLNAATMSTKDKGKLGALISKAREDRKMWQALAKTGVLQSGAKYLEGELAAMEASGAVEPKKYPLGIGPIARKIDSLAGPLERAYSAADTPWKLSSAVRDYKQAMRLLDEISPGSGWLEGRVSSQVALRLIPTSRGFQVQKMNYGTKPGSKVASKPKAISKDKAAEIVARWAMKKADDKYVDYSKTGVGKMTLALRKAKHGPGAALVSPFLTWQTKSLWVPGVKKGVAGEAFSPSVNLSSNNYKVSSKIASEALAQTARRSWALQAAMQQDDSDYRERTLAYLMTNWKGEDRSAVALKMSNPFSDEFSLVNAGRFNFATPTAALWGLAGQALGAVGVVGDAQDAYEQYRRAADSIVGDPTPEQQREIDVLARRWESLKRRGSGDKTWNRALDLLGVSAGDSPVFRVIERIQEGDVLSVDGAVAMMVASPELFTGTVSKSLQYLAGQLKREYVDREGDSGTYRFLSKLSRREKAGRVYKGFVHEFGRQVLSLGWDSYKDDDAGIEEKVKRLGRDLLKGLNKGLEKEQRKIEASGDEGAAVDAALEGIEAAIEINKEVVDELMALAEDSAYALFDSLSRQEPSEEEIRKALDGIQLPKAAEFTEFQQ